MRYAYIGFVFCWHFVFVNGSLAEELSACMESAKGETPSVIQCYDDQVGLSEKKMKEVLSSEREEGAESRVLVALNKGQSTWKEYADSVCSAYLELGGQRGDVLQKNCIATKYQERVKEIDQLLKQALF